MRTNIIHEASTGSVHLFNLPNHNTEKEIIIGIRFRKQHV